MGNSFCPQVIDNADQDQLGPFQYLERNMSKHQKMFFRQNFELKKLSERWQSFILKSPEQKRVNLKSLDLSNSPGQKDFTLTEQSMNSFTKVNLPQIETIDIRNNKIQDKGLQVLCLQGNYPSLQRINLEDNDITINGVKNIIFNKWNKKVNYELTSVQQDDGGLRLNVGQSIPTLKKIVQTKTISQLDSIIPVQQNPKLNALNLILITPLNEQDKPQKQLSQQLQKKYKNESAKNRLSSATLLVALKQNIGESLYFTEKSDIKTKIACKIISTGLLGQRIKLQCHLGSLKQFKFSDFKENHQKIQEFKKWFFNHLQSKYGVDQGQITVDKIIEGKNNSIIVLFSDSAKKFFANKLLQMANEIKAFFEFLKLDRNDFDQKGNICFPDINSASIQKRGGIPYYQPVLGMRFGINVQKQYGSDQWLLMNGNKEEWAVVFHGVYEPTKIVQSENGQMVNKIRSIMDGRKKGNMLKQGANQAKENQQCFKTNTVIGKGVYVSPYFLTCLIQYSTISPGQKYHVVLQCRARPSSIKISSSRNDYWVINKREDLRPYGIILFTEQEIKQLVSVNPQSNNLHKAIYKAEFTKQTWKNTHLKEYKEYEIHIPQITIKKWGEIF